MKFLLERAKEEIYRLLRGAGPVRRAHGPRAEDEAEGSGGGLVERWGTLLVRLSRKGDLVVGVGAILL